MAHEVPPIPLPYASTDPAALRPGERLLWEGGRRRSGGWPLWADHRPAFRVTDRRAFCVAPRPRNAPHAGAVGLPVHAAAVRLGRRRATLVLGGLWITGLWITGLDDWRPAARTVAAVPRPPRRRRRPPRPNMSTSTPPPADPTDVPTGVPADVRADLALLPDERVLWTGRPVPADALAGPAVRRTLVRVGWALVPAAILVAVAAAGIRGATVPQALIGLVAAVWLLATGHAAVVAPVQARRRLRRTSYALTTRRAFAIAPDRGGRRITFVFLDALPPTFARHHWSDGFGDVNVTAAATAVTTAVTFERVADPAGVQAQLVDAALAARRDLPDHGWPLPPTSDPDA